MKEFLESSAYFGTALSIFAYYIGTLCRRRFKCAFVNPLLIAVVLVIVFLLAAGIDYDAYAQSAKSISFLLTPATVCLAIPLYEQLDVLKKNLKAILLSILAGVLASLLSVLALAWLFDLSHAQYVTLLPKSITTAIGMDLSSELGGIASITAPVIILTGIAGSVLAEGVCRLFKITHPVAVGLAIGTSSHAIGTTKALSLGQIQGAMSSLAIAVAGLITVAAASIFAALY